MIGCGRVGVLESGGAKGSFDSPGKKKWFRCVLSNMTLAKNAVV